MLNDAKNTNILVFIIIISRFSSWMNIYLLLSSQRTIFRLFHTRIQREDSGSNLPPPEKSQSYGFLSNTGPDPLKSYKANSQAFDVGPSSARQQNAI